MGSEILQMLAEPGQRQLAVAAGAGALGACKRVWEAYQSARLNHPLFQAGLKIYPSYQADLEKTLSKDKTMTGLAVGVPAALGLEQAIVNSPVYGSYLTEAVADTGFAVAGYYAGKTGLCLFAKGVNFVVSNAYKLKNQNGTSQ